MESRDLTMEGGPVLAPVLVVGAIPHKPLYPKSPRAHQ